MKRRYSKQREKIYQLIKNNRFHPTAQWIFTTLQKELPETSRGNVYRNIQILLEEGKIKKCDFGDDVDHYDAITDLHYHFICEKCHAILDFNLPIQEKMFKMAQSITDKIITGHMIQFFGICENCRKQ